MIAVLIITIGQHQGTHRRVRRGLDQTTESIQNVADTGAAGYLRRFVRAEVVIGVGDRTRAGQILGFQSIERIKARVANLS